MKNLQGNFVKFVPFSECMNFITSWYDWYLMRKFQIKFLWEIWIWVVCPFLLSFHSNTYFLTYLLPKSFWSIQMFLGPVQNSLKLLKNGEITELKLTYSHSARLLVYFCIFEDHFFVFKELFFRKLCPYLRCTLIA